MSSENDPFGLNIDPKDAAAVKFMQQSWRELVNAAITAKADHGITQCQVAEMVGVDKSTISRLLCGRGNMTQRTIGELAWALGYEPKLLLSKIDHGKESNHNSNPEWWIGSSNYSTETSGSTETSSSTYIDSWVEHDSSRSHENA